MNLMKSSMDEAHNGVILIKYEPKLNSGSWEDPLPLSNKSNGLSASTATYPKSKDTDSITNSRKSSPTTPIKHRSDPINTITVAAVAAASSLRQSFSATAANNSHQYNLQQQHQQIIGSGRKKSTNNGDKRQNIENLLSDSNLKNSRNCNGNGRFQRTLSLDEYQEKFTTSTAAATIESRKPNHNCSNDDNVQKKNAKNKKLMLNTKYSHERSISFDGNENQVDQSDKSDNKSCCGGKSDENNADEDSEEKKRKNQDVVVDDADGEEEVVLRRKTFDSAMDEEEHCGEHDKTGILSSLISTSQRNSQLRSTFNKAKHHLSFEKWRSSSSSNPQSNNSHNNISNSSNHNTSNSSTPNNQDGCANNSNSSLNSSGGTTPNETSPGGRLSRWFSIRRGSSHQYDVGYKEGRDVRDGRLNSIDNEAELRIQIQQQLQPSLARLITNNAALQQLQQHSVSLAKGGKMPQVIEGDEDGYSSFGMGLGFKSSSTLKSGTINRQNLLAPMPPAPPGLNQQQLKRRHIVAAIAHSENSYVATLHRLVNDYKKTLEDGLPSLLSPSKISTLFYRLSEILHCHSLFRIALMDSVKKWDSEEKLGDVFMAAFSKPVILDIYSGFINNFSVAMELAKMETKRKSALADFFKLQQMNAHDRLSFFGLMVKPVQRFPQFILFLQDLLKYTPQGHHDRMSLQLALTQLESLAETLNERKREAEQHQAFKEMLGHISGTFNTRFLSSEGNKNRYLLREDDMVQLEFNQTGMVVKSKKRRLLLLNDKVICVSVAPKQSSDFGATEKLSFKWMYPVSDVEIIDNNTSATLSRILTAGLNRGGSLKANSSSPNFQAGSNDTSPSANGATTIGGSGGLGVMNGADNLCTEMSNLMHDYEVMSRINDLTGTLRGAYKELNCDVTKKLLASIQTLIQKKDEEMAWVDSCCLQLVVKNKSGKEETFTFQTENPSVKKEWITELRLAQLALDSNNSPAWELPEHEQRSIAKMPLFVKAQVVHKSQQQTEVRCGCYYSITSSRTSAKVSTTPRRKSSSQNYAWICTTDGSRSHIAILSQHSQQTGVLNEISSFDIEGSVVTSMEHIKGPIATSSGDLHCGDSVWMGTDLNRILIYPANYPESISNRKMVKEVEEIQQLTSCPVPANVIQIVFHPDGVFVALRNGIMLIFRRRGNGEWNLKEPQNVAINTDVPDSISSILPINNSIYLACGRKINVFTSNTGDLTRTFEIENISSSPNNGPIILMTHSGIGLWISVKQSSVISLYHTETFKHLQDINIAAAVLRVTSSQFKGDSINNSTIYVTALVASRGLLWVGTNVGISLNVPLPRLEGVPIISGGVSISYHAHFGPITFILPLIPKSFTSSPNLTLTYAQSQKAATINEEPKEILKVHESMPKATKVSPSNSTVSSSSSSSASDHQPILMCRRKTLEKQNSIDSPFSAAISSKFRAQFTSSPVVLRRQRFKDSDSIRMSQTLPRSLGSSQGYFSQSIHSNTSSSSSSQGSEQNCCDVYGLYGDLIFVKEDYEAEDGQGNIMDSAYESLRRSNPELIPVKVSTLDRRMRMKVARPRSLDLSNWSVDSRSSSLYTSSGSEESMALRMQGLTSSGTVSRNSSSASRKYQTLESQLIPSVITEQPRETGSYELDPSLDQHPNVVPSNTGTLRKKSANNGKTLKNQQSLPEIGGKRTIITLTGGRGYINWRHVWCNSTISEKHQRSGSLTNALPYPRVPNSSDAHIVVWEKKL